MSEIQRNPDITRRQFLRGARAPMGFEMEPRASSEQHMKKSFNEHPSREERQDEVFNNALQEVRERQGDYNLLSAVDIAGIAAGAAIMRPPETVGRRPSESQIKEVDLDSLSEQEIDAAVSMMEAQSFLAQRKPRQ
jgi:hypothetical protein